MILLLTSISDKSQKFKKSLSFECRRGCILLFIVTTLKYMSYKHIKHKRKKSDKPMTKIEDQNIKEGWKNTIYFFIAIDDISKTISILFLVKDFSFLIEEFYLESLLYFIVKVIGILLIYRLLIFIIWWFKGKLIMIFFFFFAVLSLWFNLYNIFSHVLSTNLTYKSVIFDF